MWSDSPRTKILCSVSLALFLFYSASPLSSHKILNNSHFQSMGFVGYGLSTIPNTILSSGLNSIFLEVWLAKNSNERSLKELNLFKTEISNQLSQKYILKDQIEKYRFYRADADNKSHLSEIYADKSLTMLGQKKIEILNRNIDTFKKSKTSYSEKNLIHPSIITNVCADVININAANVINDLTGENSYGINVNYLMDDDSQLNPSTGIVNAITNLGTKTLRFPGGEKSDNYLFSQPPFTSINPAFAVQGSCNFPNGDSRFSSNQTEPSDATLDFDEFMAVAQATQNEPFIVVSGDAHYNQFSGCTFTVDLEDLLVNAEEWVKYANVTNNYDIKYWMIGNESWNSAAYDSNNIPSGSQYATDVIQFSQRMKAIDPTIKIVANTREGSYFNALLQNPTALSAIDAVAISNYPIFNWTSYSQYENGNYSFVDKINQVQDQLNSNAPASDIEIITTEYAAVDFSNGWTNANDLAHAIVTFQILGDQLTLTDITKTYMWNTRWINQDTQTLEVFDAIDSNGSLTAVGKALKLFHDNMLDKFVSSSNSDTCNVNSFTTISNDNQNLNVIIINKEGSQKTVNVNVSNFDISSANYTIQEFEGTSITDTSPSLAQGLNSDVQINNQSFSIDMSGYSIKVIQFESNNIDNTPPSIPLNLQSPNQFITAIDASWDSSTDNVSVAGYNVYLDGILVNGTSTVDDTFFTITGLTPNTPYTISVSAVDTSGNESLLTNSISVNTASGNASDTINPTIPNNLVISNLTTSTVDLSWDSSTDNIAVAGYKLYLNGELVNTTLITNTNYTFTGLDDSRAYQLSVKAIDTNGNESLVSEPRFIFLDKCDGC